jgi:hypothetical protein
MHRLRGVRAECPVDAIKPDTELELEKWLSVGSAPRTARILSGPPGELSIDPIADERLVRVTEWVGAS